MESPTTSTIRRSAQACDACKMRKVKCNGQIRCQQCSHLDLKCVYSAPMQRRKPSKRGEVIERYKSTSRSSTSTDSTHLSPEGPSDFMPSQQLQQQQKLPALASLFPRDSTQPMAPPPLATPAYGMDFFLSFLDDYQQSVYPVNPIITQQEVRTSIMEMQHNSEARAFVYSLVAVTIHLTHCSPDAERETSAQIDYWVDMTIRSQSPMTVNAKASPRLIMTSQFLHICFLAMRKPDLAFYYLRQSICLIQLLRIDEPTVMNGLSLQERARRQRLYSEAFVHERYHAIADYKRVILPPLPTLPEDDQVTPLGIQAGWNQIVRVFSLVDETFVNNWIDSRSGGTAVSPNWIEEKHRQIDAEPAGDDDQMADLTDMQQADLIITKHWIRTLVWQMAISKCMLSSTSGKESMSLLFPVRLSVQLKELVSSMSRKAIEIHGSGIQQKLFELTDTIASVIITVPAASLEETAGRVEDFAFLIGFLFSLPRFNPLHKEILQKKLETLQEMFILSSQTPQSCTSGPEDFILGDEYVSRSDPWLGVVKDILGPSR